MFDRWGGHVLLLSITLIDVDFCFITPEKLCSTFFSEVLSLRLLVNLVNPLRLEMRTPTSWSDLILQLNTDFSSPPRCTGLFGRGTTVPFDNVCVSQLHLRRLWATQSLKWLLPAEERLRSKVSTYFWVILAASVRGIKEYGTVTTENIIMLPLRAKNTEMKRQCRGNRGFTLQVTETQCTIIITEDK